MKTVLMSGGVSERDRDLVPKAFQRCGYRLLFERVAMQPGRPTVFGFDGKSYCCGLPGNPVSTFVVFEILLKPFVYSLMGCAYRAPVAAVVMGKAYKRRKTERQCAIPVRFETGRAIPIEYHGSAHISALTRADALLIVPVGVSEIAEGTEVHVRLL